MSGASCRLMPEILSAVPSRLEDRLRWLTDGHLSIGQR